MATTAAGPRAKRPFEPLEPLETNLLLHTTPSKRHRAAVCSPGRPAAAVSCDAAPRSTQQQAAQQQHAAPQWGAHQQVRASAGGAG